MLVEDDREVEVKESSSPDDACEDVTVTVVGMLG